MKNRLFKSFPILIAFILLISSMAFVPVSADDFTGYYGEPHLISLRQINRFWAGQEGTLKVTIKNISSDYAVRAELTLESAVGLEDLFAELDYTQMTSVLGSIGMNNEKSCEFTFFFPDTIPQGNYEIKATLRYYNYDLRGYEKELSIPLYVSNPSAKNTTDIVLSDFASTNIVLKFDDKFDISFNVSNEGNARASALSVSFEGAGSSTFIPLTNISNLLIPELKSGESKDFKFSFKPSSTLATGSYPLCVSIKYVDVNGKDMITSHEIYLDYTAKDEVVEDKGKAKIDIINAYLDGNMIKHGASGKIVVELINSGEKIAENVIVRLGGFSGNVITLDNVDGNLTYINIGDLETNAVYKKEYFVSAPNTVTESSASLTLTVTYKNKGETLTETMTIPVAIGVAAPSTPTPTPAPSIPRVIIESFVSSQSPINSGAVFDFSFVLKNTSKLTSVSNMKVTVSSETGIFLPASGSNTFYIPSIGKNELHEISMPLQAKISAETKTYPVTISIDYEDSEGKQYSAVENVSLSVVQPLILSVSNLNYQSDIMTYQQNMFTFEYINKGKTKLNNLTIDVNCFYSELFESQEAPIWEGDFEGDYEQDYDNFKPDPAAPIVTFTNTSSVMVERVSVGSSMVMPMFTKDGGGSTSSQIDGFMIDPISTFIGNMDPGTMDYYDFMLTPYMVGVVEGEIIFTYENDLGEIFTHVEPFSFTSMEMPSIDVINPEYPEYPDYPNENSEGMSTVMKIALFGGIPLVAVITGIIITVVIVKNKKKEADEDEDS